MGSPVHTTITKTAEAVRQAVIQLRPYQQDLFDRIHHQWSLGKQNVLAVAPTGAGKTVLLSAIVHDHNAATCVIAHRQELVSQISIALARNGIRHRIIGPDKLIRMIVSMQMTEVGLSFYDPSARVAVAGVDTLVRREKQLASWLPTVTLWVQDECFPAGTLVDGKPICELKIGDKVTAFNEQTDRYESRPVTHVFKNKSPSHMVRIVTKAHHVLHCTAGHPIFTKRGWVEAIDLTSNDEVLINEMSHVRESGEQAICDNVPLQKDGERLLRRGLLEQVSIGGVIENNVEYEQKICVGKNENEQPDARRINTVKNERHADSHGSSTKSERWERERTDESGADVILPFRVGRIQPSDDSFDGRLGETRLSETLQNRLRKPVVKDSNRSRRDESLQLESTGTGFEKGQVSYWVGLDSVTVHESRDLEQSGECDHDGHVYNIEVEGLHTYVAGGVTVHNCHHVLVKNKWGKAAEMFPNAKGLGVTATPSRADGAGLGRHADGLFDVMVEGPTMRTLIDDGYLTEYRIFAPPSDLDMTKVIISKTTGDFNVNATRDAVEHSSLIVSDDKTRIVGDVVNFYLQKFKGMLAVVFVPSVTAAEQLETQFISAGVIAKSLNGNTADDVRSNAIRKFGRREIHVLINVALFDEGFDCPAIEVVMDAYPTQSYSRFAQRFGRMLRLMDGKDFGIYSDHACNVKRHGLPDAHREWTLDRREKRSLSENDAAPVRTCLNEECFAVYERYHKACPFCGEPIPEPSSRSGPELVDGDLFELDAETLAEMRGEVAKVDTPNDTLWPELTPVTLNSHVQDWGKQLRTPQGINRASQMKKYAVKFEREYNENRDEHSIQQASIGALREIMAEWAGYHRAAGRDDSEIFKRFYLAYNVDWLSAQALNSDNAMTLIERVSLDIGRV